MSSTTPPPDMPGPSWEQLPPGQSWNGPVESPPSRGGSRLARALVIAVALAVVAGGGVFAFVAADPFNLFKSGPQAAEAIPSDALFYVSVDLDPSAEQKISALRFLNHFPAFKGVSGVTDAKADIRKTIVEKALESTRCGDVSYEKDIAPWLGNKFAVAGMPATGGSTSPIPLIALEVSDVKDARAGLDKLAACDASSKPFGVASSGGYLLVTETQAEADRYAAAASSASLADNKDFQADMDALGDLGVATAWVNVSDAINLLSADLPLAGRAAQLDTLRSTYQRAAMTFRFASSHAELASVFYGDTPSIEHADNQIGSLPNTTVFAVSEAGGANRLAASWGNVKKALQQSGVSLDTELQKLEDQTGLSVPADLETVLGDNLMFAVDGTGLTAGTIQGSDPTKLNAGVRFTGDKDALLAIYNKIDTLVHDQFGVDNPFVKLETSDGLVIASNDTYARTLSGSGTLGNSDAFTSVVSSAADQEFVLFFNFDGVESQLLETAQNAGAPSEVLDNLRPLQALALTSSTQGSYTHSSFVVSVND